MNDKPGYHLVEIKRGTFGEVSKIQEEVLELEDAIVQKNKIMALNELADIIGAVEGYLLKNYKDLSFDDLIKMKDCTKRAFENGRRT